MKQENREVVKHFIYLLGWGFLIYWAVKIILAVCFFIERIYNHIN